MMIDNQYYECYLNQFGFKLVKLCVLPILRELQGHPESGKFWGNYINSNLISPELKFQHITHNRIIYKTNFGPTT